MEIAHSTRRLAKAVLTVLSSDEDVRTLTSWSHRAGVSQTQLRVYCAMARVDTKDTLDFARLLRAVLFQEERGWFLSELLDVADPRTLSRLLSKAGIPGDVCHFGAERYLGTQDFVTNLLLLAEVRIGMRPFVAGLILPCPPVPIDL